MKQLNKEKPFSEKLDHKHRNKSELVFYKLMAKQKAKANPFNVVRSENDSPANEIKSGPDYA